MSDAPNTLFLRLEGPLQAWGDTSKFVIRRTMEAPTKSGVLGMICCAMGVRRNMASQHPIPDTLPRLGKLAERLLPEKRDNEERPCRTILGLLNTLAMGVRIDRAGVRWWDYHTVGAKVGLLKAEGGIKRTASTKEIETLITRREYLADASFLLSLQGDASLIQEVADALAKPQWPLYLGRKSCPPAVPVLARPGEGENWTNPGTHVDLLDALKHVPWRPRLVRVDGHAPERDVLCLIEWRAAREGDIAPADAEVWYDTPVSFDPPVHEPRLVQRTGIQVAGSGPLQHRTTRPSRPRAGYSGRLWETVSGQRLRKDHHLCVFCKSPLTKYNRTVQHVTYRHAGGEERLDELRSLCRLCHDAVTMIEYGLGMGLDRINPEDPRWRDQIIKKRAEIIEFRSLETRRRRLSPEEV